FKAGYETLKSGAIQIDEFTDTRFSGKVNAKEDCVLFTSVPYDEGWQVKIDGKKVNTFYLSDKAVVAVDMPAGEHNVEFSYHVKGLMLGACISAGALLFLILFLIIRAIARLVKDKKKAVYFADKKPQNATPIENNEEPKQLAEAETETQEAVEESAEGESETTAPVEEVVQEQEESAEATEASEEITEETPAEENSSDPEPTEETE
ncbi:MAG: YfhO family protein, partial [Clostridia bacterium]|nr:YfhO family protein [Clostridia bacterium]